MDIRLRPRKALNQQIGPTDPIAVVNAMAAEEERRHADVDPYVHQDMADRLAQLDQPLRSEETSDNRSSQQAK